jgi:hypothetical protein
LENETVKKSNATPTILAAMATVTGCAPIEPVAQVPDDDVICRMESPMGSHVKEENCKRASGIENSDRDIENIFGDIVREPMQDSPDVAEGKCGSQ